MFKKMNEAKEILFDPARRSEYDANLATKRAIRQV
jgi:curved DNA-binding protein CbpA